MNRTKDERVEIVIDPGNYEEMLVIDMPAVEAIQALKSQTKVLTLEKT